MGFAGAMLVALVFDAVLGWPGGLFARVGHPVTWLGALISALDARWNRSSDTPATRRMSGVAAVLIVIALAAGVGWLLRKGWLSRPSRIAMLDRWHVVKMR